MRRLHLTNAKQRDATIRIRTIPEVERAKLGVIGKNLRYLRFAGAAEDGLHSKLQVRFGDDYGQALLDADPEVDLEYIGQEIGRTDRIYLASDGAILNHAPKEVDLIIGPDGEERERRDPRDVPANVNEDLPLRWTGKRIAKTEVVRRYVLTRSIALQHVDGLTYDYLFEMAKDLHESGEMMLMGGGKSGKEPVILIANGSPYRGLLEGRVEGAKYRLLLHLSNMELKVPKGSE